MRRAVLVLTAIIAGVAAPSGAAAKRLATQTLVFDAVAKNRFLDRAPMGPSLGDTEFSTARLRDSSGRFVGSTRDRCVFTKVLAHDVLERCSGRGKTTDGTVTLSGVGHLESMNPPWQVTGLSGAYKGLRGTQTFATDIALDPNVPLAAGRFFSVSVIRVTTKRRLHAGVVPRPAANTGFIRRANKVCRATAARASGFPFPNFDPFHPDPTLLPQVGRFFEKQVRLPRALFRKLKKLGEPPTSAGAWRNVLKTRRAVLTVHAEQIKAALADNAPAFVRTVYRTSRAYNQLVFASAIFGSQSCTFS